MDGRGSHASREAGKRHPCPPEPRVAQPYPEGLAVPHYDPVQGSTHQGEDRLKGVCSPRAGA